MHGSGRADITKFKFCKKLNQRPRICFTALLWGTAFIRLSSSGCISLLGMEGGGIAESQITASSIRYTMLGLQRWGTELARLHNKGLVNAWSAAPHDKNPWIQVSTVTYFSVTWAAWIHTEERWTTVAESIQCSYLWLVKHWKDGFFNSILSCLFKR